MIFFGILSAAFFYFIAFVIHVEWPAFSFFAAVAIFVMIFHSKKHFKISQITFFFLYLITLLLWARGSISLVPQFIFLLGSASLTFILSDIFFKTFFGILSWSFVGMTISLLMYERFGTLYSLLVGLIVIPIGLRDRRYVKDKDRAS